MANQTIYNVVHRDNKWKVMKKGASRASATSKRRTDARDKAQDFAKNNKPSKVILRNKDASVFQEYDYGSKSRGSLTWEKKSNDRFHYTLRASNPDRAFDTRYKIEVIGNNAEFIDYQAFGSDNKTRKTFDSNKDAVKWAKNKKRKLTKKLEREGWRN